MHSAKPSRISFKSVVLRCGNLFLFVHFLSQLLFNRADLLLILAHYFIKFRLSDHVTCRHFTFYMVRPHLNLVVLHRFVIKFHIQLVDLLALVDRLALQYARLFPGRGQLILEDRNTFL